MGKNMTRKAFKKATAFDVSYCAMGFLLALSFFIKSLLAAF